MSATQAEGATGRPALVVGPVRGARLHGPRLDRFRASQRMGELGMGGFWRYAAERLFVLEEAMRAAGLSRCLHIESDNLLYAPSATYDSWLDERYGEGVAACPLTDEEDTAAVLYVGSLPALERMNDGLLELASLGGDELLRRHGGGMANEMRMLRLLRDRELVDALPTTAETARREDAPVVFDAASYGQVVDGIPSAPGVPYSGDHHHAGRELISGHTRVIWNAQRRFPLLAAEDGAERPLANLHIHSKRLERFTTEWERPAPPRPPGPVRRGLAFGRAGAGALARRASAGWSK